MINRGDIRWFRFERPDKRRPVLVLGRQESISALSQIVVVPFSTNIRGLPGEVVLDERDGMAVRCTLKVEWLRAVERSAIGASIAALPHRRWPEVRLLVLHVLGLDDA